MINLIIFSFPLLSNFVIVRDKIEKQNHFNFEITFKVLKYNEQNLKWNEIQDDY